MDASVAYALAIGEVAWINVLLSGDNAVVIAMACRSLPDRQRKIGVMFGAGAAILLRIAFAFVVTWLLDTPFLKAIGGALLLFIAVSLARGGDGEGKEVAAPNQLWRAVATIAIADAAMSLDNVIAIAAVADGDYYLFTIGLALSIPLIVVGATLITRLLVKLPIIVWAGAALLGWVGGHLIAEDESLMHLMWRQPPEAAVYITALACTGLVVIAAYLLRRYDARKANA